MACRKSQIANRKSQIANRKSQIANRKSQIANRKSQIANRKSQISLPHYRTTSLMSRAKSFFPLVRSALLVALLTVLALTLAYQVRTRVLIDVGSAYDAPFVARFFDAEDDGTQTYRWTRDISRVHLDAQNLTAPWTLRLRLNGYRPNRPAQVQVQMNGATVDSFRVLDGWDEYESEGAVATDAWTGDNVLTFVSDTFVPQKEIEGSTDKRKLGVVIDWVELKPARSDAFLGTDDAWIDFGNAPVLPPLLTLASWACACALLFMTARGIGVPKRAANVFIAAVIFVIALSAAFARMWVGYYTASFLTLSAVLAIVALLLVLLLPRFAKHCAVVLDARALTVLSAIVLLSIGLKWGGVWYPQFRSSDLLFHAHRLEFVARGELFFTSELPDAARRVVPYPPALYVALAPFTAFSQEYAALLLVLNALADALAILAIFFAAARLVKQKSEIENQKSAFALFAAFLVAFNPVSFWIYSWGNHTNIFAQDAATIFFALLLVLPMTRPRNFLLALFFLLLASVGHLGVFLSLLAFLPLAMILRAVARDENARGEALALGALFVSGLLLSWGLYYAEFADALTTQTQKFLGDFGAGRAAGRSGITFARVLDVARYTREQLGWVLLLLGLGGMPLAWKNFDARARAMWGAWLLVGIAFALVTIGSTFSTRYTLWAAPALALSGACALLWIFHRARAGKWIAYALCGIAFAQTLWLWLDRVWNGYH